MASLASVGQHYFCSKAVIIIPAEKLLEQNVSQNDFNTNRSVNN